MSAKNTVVAGDYKGKSIKASLGRIYIDTLLGKDISKKTVESYEVVGQDAQKSMGSGIVKGIIGGALLGGIGAIAGASSGKSKVTYTVSIVFKDGKRALCELDEDMYKRVIKALY